MALAQFRTDIRTKDDMNAFMLKHATLSEFINFFTTKKDMHGRPWSNSYAYGDTIIGNMQGLAETFCKEVLWVRLKDKYIEDAVKSLEQKVEQSFKITIESI